MNDKNEFHAGSVGTLAKKKNTTNNVDQQGIGGNRAIACQRRREKKKFKSQGLRAGCLNVGMMKGKGRDLDNVLHGEEKKVEGQVQGFRMYYQGVARNRNEVGVILKEEYSKKR